MKKRVLLYKEETIQEAISMIGSLNVTGANNFTLLGGIIATLQTQAIQSEEVDLDEEEQAEEE